MTDDLERLVGEAAAKAVRERYELTPKPAPDPLAVTGDDIWRLGGYGPDLRTGETHLTLPQLRALVVRVNKRVIEGQRACQGMANCMVIGGVHIPLTDALRVFCGEEAP